MSTTDILEKTNLTMRVTGVLDDADREHLTSEQIDQIERLDRRMSAWLERDPDHQRQFLREPTVAIAAATGELPSSGSKQQVDDPAQGTAEVLQIAELASFEQPQPTPVSTFGLKEPTAQNDVTYMLSLDALTKAFQVATARPLDDAMPSGDLWAPLDVPNSSLALSILAAPLDGPVLRFVDSTVQLAIEFQTRLKIEVHDIEPERWNFNTSSSSARRSPASAPSRRCAALTSADGSPWSGPRLISPTTVPRSPNGS